MKHGILQTKTAKRGTKRLLCLLLALMMTTGDALKLFPPVEADAANGGMDTTDRMLYKWHRVEKGSDLAQTVSGKTTWVPVLIGYKADNGTEYCLDLRGTETTTKNKFKAVNWTSKAKTNGYPSLCDSKNEFWTLDDPLTDLAVFQLEAKDDGTEYFKTFLIGRNVNWGKITLSEEQRLEEITKETAAAQILACGYGYDDLDFTDITSDHYKKGKEWRKTSFRNWTIVGKDETAPNIKESNQPAKGLNAGKMRIMAQHYNASDSCLVYEGDTVYSTNYSYYDYPAGEYCIWKGERTKMATLLHDYTIEQSVLNIDSEMLIAEGVTLTIPAGSTLTIDTTLYNNGTIINYGTIFLLEGGCIRTLNPTKDGKTSQDCGKIICSGEKQQGEGNLVMFQNSSIILDEGKNLFALHRGAVAEINGTLICPNSFVLDNADIRIREKGKLISQYAITDRFLKVENMTFTKKAAQSGAIEATPALKAMNKTAVPTPYYSAGSVKLTNEGYFAHLTDPKSMGEVAAEEEERQRLADKYLKNPVWPQSALDDKTYGEWVFSAGTGFWDISHNKSISGLSYKMFGALPVKLDNGVNTYWYHVAQFNTAPNETQAVSGQNPKSFRGELVEFSSDTYHAGYLLDSSGWYTARNLTNENVTYPEWSKARDEYALSYLAEEMQYYSWRRQWDGSKKYDNAHIVKEGHYDPESDTFITYDYKEKVQYIEYRDGRVQVYTFTGDPGSEVQLAYLGEKAGTGPVDLRTDFNKRGFGSEYFQTPVWPESVVDYAKAYVAAGKDFLGRKLVTCEENNWPGLDNMSSEIEGLHYTGFGFDSSMYREDGGFEPIIAMLNSSSADRPAHGQTNESYRGQMVTWFQAAWNRKTSSYTKESPYEAQYLLDSSGWYTTCKLDYSKQIDASTLPAWSTVAGGGRADLTFYSYRRLWDDSGTKLLKEGHYDRESDTFITYDYSKMLNYIEYPGGTVEVYRFTGSAGSEKRGELLGLKMSTGYVDLRIRF